MIRLISFLIISIQLSLFSQTFDLPKAQLNTRNYLPNNHPNDSQHNPRSMSQHNPHTSQERNSEIV
ncbi:MAG: hypothetical protein R3250_07920, partial [Melioribacteraceae bacterium]|nr:hypothetical protein [Melioribacteraceae bacterium]